MAPAEPCVLLVRHAPTPATRDAAFPADEALDAEGRHAARSLQGLSGDHVVASPSRRCGQTAAAAGWAVEVTDPRWAELDFGGWAGRSYAEVAEQRPRELAAWHADPVAVSPAGGETLAALAARVRAALADLHGRAGTTLVVTSGGPVKVAILHATGQQLDRVWSIEVPPTSVTELRPCPDGGWAMAAGPRVPGTVARSA